VKIVRYVDVYPGCVPDSLFFQTSDHATRNPKEPGYKRYRVEFDVPDPAPKDSDGPVDGLQIEEVDDE